MYFFRLKNTWKYAYYWSKWDAAFSYGTRKNKKFETLNTTELKFVVTDGTNQWIPYILDSFSIRCELCRNRDPNRLRMYSWKDQRLLINMVENCLDRTQYPILIHDGICNRVHCFSMNGTWNRTCIRLFANRLQIIWNLNTWINGKPIGLIVAVVVVL